MSQASRKPKLLLAYDADCGSCASFKNLVSFLDPRGRLGYLSLGEAEREGLLQTVPARSRYSSAHLVLPDGRVLSGALAVARMLELLPAGRITSKVAEKFAPGRQIVSFAYDAASRLHESGACSRDPGGFD